VFSRHDAREVELRQGPQVRVRAVPVDALRLIAAVAFEPQAGDGRSGTIEAREAGCVGGSVVGNLRKSGKQRNERPLRFGVVVDGLTGDEVAQPLQQKTKVVDLVRRERSRRRRASVGATSLRSDELLKSDQGAAGAQDLVTAAGQDRGREPLASFYLLDEPLGVRHLRGQRTQRHPSRDPPMTQLGTEDALG